MTDNILGVVEEREGAWNYLAGTLTEVSHAVSFEHPNVRLVKNSDMDPSLKVLFLAYMEGVVDRLQYLSVLQNSVMRYLEGKVRHELTLADWRTINSWIKDRRKNSVLRSFNTPAANLKRGRGLEPGVKVLFVNMVEDQTEHFNQFEKAFEKYVKLVLKSSVSGCNWGKELRASDVKALGVLLRDVNNSNFRSINYRNSMNAIDKSRVLDAQTKALVLAFDEEVIERFKLLSGSLEGFIRVTGGDVPFA